MITGIVKNEYNSKSVIGFAGDREALAEEMTRDQSIFLMGEEVAEYVLNWLSGVYAPAMSDPAPSSGR